MLTAEKKKSSLLKFSGISRRTNKRTNKTDYIKNKASITKIKQEHNEGMLAASILVIYYPFQWNSYAWIYSKQLQKPKYPLNNLFLCNDGHNTCSLLHPASSSETPLYKTRAPRDLPPPPHLACTSHRVSWNSVVGTVTISVFKSVCALLAPQAINCYLATQHTLLQRLCLSPGTAVFAACKGKDGNFKNAFSDTLKILKFMTSKKWRSAPLWHWR